MLLVASKKSSSPQTSKILIACRRKSCHAPVKKQLLALPETPPAHSYFGQIMDTDGTVLLCVHEWGEHEHPSLTSPDRVEPGNGLLLFFRVDDFDVARECAHARRTF